MAFRPARLFHAVVVSGAALVGCQPAPTREVPMAPPDGDGAAAPAGSGAPTAAPSATGRETAPPPSAPTSSATAKPWPAAKPRPDGGCPPGSEIPVPPCYYIR